METPTNVILLGLAIADLLVVGEYVPYASSSLVQQDNSTWSHAIYLLIHAHLSHVCHTIAIWLTIMLGVTRWIAVCHPHQAPKLCTLPYCRRAVTIVYVIFPILATPFFLMYAITSKEDSSETKSADYLVDFSSIALAQDCLLIKVNFVIFTVLVKLVPCLLLTLLIPTIIKGMWKAATRRRKLTSRRRCKGGHPNSKDVPVTRSAERLRASFRRKLTILGITRNKQEENATERTTQMLVLLLVLFLITEAPQGILVFLSV
ncbi:unnamed protein product, partial [Meganyctiphanes norvegica]